MIFTHTHFLNLFFHSSISEACLSVVVLTFCSKIVAFARCRYPAQKPAHDEDDGEFPKGSNAELLSHWFERMDYFKDKHLDYEKDFCESSTPGGSKRLNVPCTGITPKTHSGFH